MVQRKAAELAALTEGSKSEAEFARQAVQVASGRASAAEAAAEQLRAAVARLEQQLQQAQGEASAAHTSAQAEWVPSLSLVLGSKPARMSSAATHRPGGMWMLADGGCKTMTCSPTSAGIASQGCFRHRLPTEGPVCFHSVPVVQRMQCDCTLILTACRAEFGHQPITFHHAGWER